MSRDLVVFFSEKLIVTTFRLRLLNSVWYAKVNLKYYAAVTDKQFVKIKTTFTQFFFTYEYHGNDVNV